MRILTQFLFLALFAGLFTGCIEEQDVIITSTPEVVTEVDPGTDDPVVTNRFTYQNANALMSNAYVQTTAVSDNEYRHHLMITESDVFSEGDLRLSTRAAAGVIFVTNSPSLVGTHQLTSTADSPVKASGMDYNVDFSYLQYFVRDDTHRNGTVTIAENNGEYTIAVDLRASTAFYNITGTYVGEVKTVEQAGAEPVTDADFTGANHVVRNGTEIGIVKAYGVRTYTESGPVISKVYFARRAIDNGGRLTGTSDVFYVNLNGGNLATGRYQEASYGTQTGYFTALSAGTGQRSYWCTNMNFQTGGMDDDDPMDTGETLVSYEDDVLRFRMVGVGYTGTETVTEYNGPITIVND